MALLASSNVGVRRRPILINFSVLVGLSISLAETYGLSELVLRTRSR